MAQYEIWSALIGDKTSVVANVTSTLTIASNASDTGGMYRRYVYLVSGVPSEDLFSVTGVAKTNDDPDPNTGEVYFKVYTISTGGLADWMSEAEAGSLYYSWESSSLLSVC